MKKFFFFRSSSSSGGNTQVPPLTDKQVNWESPSKRPSVKVENSFRNSNGLFPKSQKPTHETQNSATSPRLRRSLSFSSVAFSENDALEKNSHYLSNQSRSPLSSGSSIRHQQYNRSSRGHSLTPEKLPKGKLYESRASEMAKDSEKPRSAGSARLHHDSAGNSSLCSSNVFSTVLDRYIDGEQQQEKSRPTFSSQIERSGVGNTSGRRPPRVQYTAPTSPRDDDKHKPRCRSFRDPNQHYFSSKDWAENETEHESHRKLAKHVIEKLSQPHVSSRTSSKGFEPDTPITIEEIYGKSSHRSSDSASAQVGHKNVGIDEPYELVDNFHPEEPFDFQKQYSFGGYLDSLDTQEDISEDLHRKFKTAKERVCFLSEVLEQESFLQDSGFDVPALIQKIRDLSEERVGLALEVSAALQDHIEDRGSTKDSMRLAKVELDSRTRRLEKEKNELQTALEKELDRRSSDWSLKLEKYHSEEQRLRDRVRELAEQNVSLQREVTSFNEKLAGNRSVMTHLDSQSKDLALKLEDMGQENQNLQENLSSLQDKYLVVTEERHCIQANYDKKENECEELHKSIRRLLRTCNEQEKTIGGLREGLSDAVEKKQVDKCMGKLQMEQVRLTGVEQALRREVESYRAEVDSLRLENIGLLNRLKLCGKEGGFSTFKLDQELCSRLSCLQSQGIRLLNESTQLCSNLVEFVKDKAGNGLDRQFLVESDVKVQGFKRGTEKFMRSLQTMSDLLHEKSSISDLDSQPYCTKDVESGSLNTDVADGIVRSRLKAESLLTGALQDKLLSKQMDIEQLQAELAAAVRGNDILRCEAQNATDRLSCATHELKDIELQMMKKDENIKRLQNDLQESMKELTVVKSILPKVTQERDLIWEEVKQYNEANMLLNSEVNMLKKKVEALDEDVLVKEGQITILKDSLGKGSFSLLDDSDPTREFLLE